MAVNTCQKAAYIFVLIIVNQKQLYINVHALCNELIPYIKVIYVLLLLRTMC